MPAPCQPDLRLATVYRTEDLSQWGTNPSRLAKRLVAEGCLKKLGWGLFVTTQRSKFGVLPPKDEELLHRFLYKTPFVITGPERWNVLNLGSTAVASLRIVYNQKRSGIFNFDGQKFLLKRIPFPQPITSEWFVVDLIEHREMVSLTMDLLEEKLILALKWRRFDPNKLQEMANRFGKKTTMAFVKQVVQAAAS